MPYFLNATDPESADGQLKEVCEKTIFPGKTPLFWLSSAQMLSVGSINP
jgi:hypothetical protein